VNTYRGTRPREMDPSSWAAFRRAWNAASSEQVRVQLCAEYGLAYRTALDWTSRGVGLHRVGGQQHNRRAG